MYKIKTLYLVCICFSGLYAYINNLDFKLTFLTKFKISKQISSTIVKIFKDVSILFTILKHTFN